MNKVNHHPNNSITSDVDAIDNLSALLIDISASASRSNLSEINTNTEENNAVSLLEKLRSNELVIINEALSGWKNNPNIIAPCYKATQIETQALFNYIHNNKSISKSVLNLITKNKACSANFQRLIIGQNILSYNSEFYKSQVKTFLYELKYGIFTLNKVFEKSGLTKVELKLFHNFVAMTASTLFNLGFADSVNHSVQVARKCVIEAYRKKLSKVELLQAAMVGWIHDPKLPGNYSWSNLSTHPVMASAIALDVLTQTEMQKEIELYLKKHTFLEKNRKNFELFVKGVVEAVAINNDSKFVLDNAIFIRPEWAPGLPESGGVIDQVSTMTHNELISCGIGFDSEELIKDIKEIALDRFYAPSNLKKPASFNNETLKVLKKVKLETGLIGINIGPFKNICCEMAKEYDFINTQTLSEIIDQILLGTINNDTFITSLNSHLQATQKAEKSIITNVKVCADKLFCHHDEMKFAPYAAFNLAIADRLLLSPHKILEAGVQNTVLGRVISFMDSFEDNIQTLPKLAQCGGKIFQRDLYVSILKTIDKLSNNNNFNTFNASLIGLPEKYLPFNTVASKNIDLKTISLQVEYLEYLIKESKNWYNKTNQINFAEIDPKNTLEKKNYDLVLDTFKEYYDFTIEQSPEMFGYIKIKKFNLIEKLLLRI